MKWKQKNKPKHAGVLITSAIRHQNVGTKNIRQAAILAVSTKTAIYKKRLKKQD
jgi:hypothetical protein